MPRKIRQLISDLEKAGFYLADGGKGSHRKFRHVQANLTVIISGKTGDDAKRYQEADVKMKIELSQK